MAKTNQEIKMEFGGEEITIPKGTKVTHQTALGFDKNYNFVDEFGWYKPELTGFARKMALHDMVHYGINLDSKFIEEGE